MPRYTPAQQANADSAQTGRGLGVRHSGGGDMSGGKGSGKGMSGGKGPPGGYQQNPNGGADFGAYQPSGGSLYRAEAPTTSYNPMAPQMTGGPSDADIRSRFNTERAFFNPWTHQENVGYNTLTPEQLSQVQNMSQADRNRFATTRTLPQEMGGFMDYDAFNALDPAQQSALWNQSGPNTQSMAERSGLARPPGADHHMWASDADDFVRRWQANNPGQSQGMGMPTNDPAALMGGTEHGRGVGYTPANVNFESQAVNPQQVLQAQGGKKGK